MFKEYVFYILNIKFWVSIGWKTFWKYTKPIYLTEFQKCTLLIFLQVYTVRNAMNGFTFLLCQEGKCRVCMCLYICIYLRDKYIISIILAFYCYHRGM